MNITSYKKMDVIILIFERYINCVRFCLVKKRNSIFIIFRNRKRVEKAVSEHDYLVARIPSIYGMMAVKYAQKLNKPLFN